MASLSVAACLVLIALGGLAGYLDGRRRQSLEARAAPYLVLLSVLAFAALGTDMLLSFHDSIQWDVPLDVLVWYVPVTRGIVLWTLAFGVTLVATVAARSRNANRLALFIAIALAVAPIPIMQWQYGRPVVVGEPRTKDGLRMQSTGYTCVPTSAANIAHLLGVDATERELAARMGTTASGTTVAQLACGMREIGLQCRLRITEQIAEVQAPAVLFVQLGALPHAVAYVGMKGDRAEIWDPMRGRKLMREPELRIMWPGNAVEIFR